MSNSEPDSFSWGKILANFEDAKKYVHSDPAASLNKSRTALELLVNKHFVELTGAPPKRKEVEAIVNSAQLKDVIPRRVQTRMHSVRSAGNLGSHGHPVQDNDAHRALRDLRDVLNWYIGEGLADDWGNESDASRKVQFMGGDRNVAIGGMGILVVVFLSMMVIFLAGGRSSVEEPLDSKDAGQVVEPVIPSMQDVKRVPVRNGYAYAIGASEYTYLPDKQYAHSDAASFLDLMSERGYDPAGLLTDYSVTKEGLNNFLNNLLREREVADDTVLFISMRGITLQLPGGERAAYLVPVDVSLPDAVADVTATYLALRRNGFSVLQMMNTLHQVGPDRMLVVLDGCREYFAHLPPDPEVPLAGKVRQLIAGPSDGLEECTVEEGAGWLMHAMGRIMSANADNWRGDALGAKLILEWDTTGGSSKEKFQPPWVGKWVSTSSFQIAGPINEPGGRAKSNTVGLAPTVGNGVSFNLLSLLCMPGDLPVTKSGQGSGIEKPAIDEVNQQGEQENGRKRKTLVPETYLEQLMKLQTDDRNQSARKAVISWSMGKLAENPADAFAHFVLANCFLGNEADRFAFLRHASLARRIEPNIHEVYGMLGLFYQREKSWEASLKYIDEAVRLSPSDPFQLHSKGYILRLFAWSPDRQIPNETRVELTREAIECSSKALNNTNKFEGVEHNYAGNIYFNRARCHHKLREWKQAVEDYQRALEYPCSRAIRSQRKHYLDLANEREWK